MHKKKSNSIIYEMPDEEDNTISYHTPKNENSSPRVSNAFPLSDNRGKRSKSNEKNSKTNRTANIPNMNTNSVIGQLSKHRSLNEESEFLPNRYDSPGELDSNEIVFSSNGNEENNKVLKYNEVKKVHFRDAYNYFLTVDYSKDLKSMKGNSSLSKSCCQKLFERFTNKNELLDSLKTERDFVYCIAKTGYNENNIMHFEILATIYFFLTKEKECPIKGSNWAKIGFQENSPKNDLRSVGMLVPLQFLNLMDSFQNFTFFLYNFMLEKKCEWLFFVSMIQFTRITLDLMKDGKLNLFCNQRKNVFGTINGFFNGLIYYFYLEIFKKEKNTEELTAESISSIIKNIRFIAETNTSDVFWKAMQLKLLVTDI